MQTQKSGYETMGFIFIWCKSFNNENNVQKLAYIIVLIKMIVDLGSLQYWKQ